MNVRLIDGGVWRVWEKEQTKGRGNETSRRQRPGRQSQLDLNQRGERGERLLPPVKGRHLSYTGTGL